MMMSICRMVINMRTKMRLTSTWAMATAIMRLQNKMVVPLELRKMGKSKFLYCSVILCGGQCRTCPYHGNKVQQSSLMKRNGHNASCCEHVTETWIDGLSLKRHRDAEDGVVRLRKSIRQRAYLGLMGSQNADFWGGMRQAGCTR